MNLPAPGPQYSRERAVAHNIEVVRADGENYKRNADVEIAGNRLILRSPDGTKWSITVTNAGVLTATQV